MEVDSDLPGAYVSDQPANLVEHGIRHTRSRPYHPTTQGKIERYHRSMKNIILLNNYHSADDLKAVVGAFVEYYNHQRYHESLDNVTPADVYPGLDQGILEQRKQIKKLTMKQRRTTYRKYLPSNLLDYEILDLLCRQ